MEVAKIVGFRVTAEEDEVRADQRAAGSAAAAERRPGERDVPPAERERVERPQIEERTCAGVEAVSDVGGVACVVVITEVAGARARPERVRRFYRPDAGEGGFQEGRAVPLLAGERHRADHRALVVHARRADRDVDIVREGPHKLRLRDGGA